MSVDFSEVTGTFVKIFVRRTGGTPMDLGSHPYRNQIRLLLGTALVMSVFTVFVLVNLGLADFWFGLVIDEAWSKRSFTPLMGVGVQLGIGVHSARLLGGRAPQPSEAPPAV